MADIKMKGLAVIACLYFAYLAQTQEKIKYDGNQLWKIAANNKTTMRILKALQKKNYLTMWMVNSKKVDAMIHADSVDKVKEKFLEKNLEYKIMLEDVQKAIDEENPKPVEGLEGRKGYRLTWDYYHNLNDIYDYLHYLEETFPTLCTIRTIGRSVEGRPIKLLRISNKNPANKAVFIEGGIHAREWIAPAAVTYIINNIITNYEKEPLHIRNIDWYFIPVLNPDGYEYSYNIERLWRKNRSKGGKNCIGVDLNRNWGYDWGKNGSSGDPCSNSYRGRKPFSEPETAAVARFFLDNPNINWMGYISVHNYGQFILYPWGNPNAVVEDHEQLNKIGTEAAKAIKEAGGKSYTVGSVAATVYTASGCSMDWARGAQAIKYSFTIELRDRDRYGFILPARFIKPSSEEALTLIKKVAVVVNT